MNISSAQNRDRWIPWYFVLFFLVIATVDGIFVTLAIRTMPGEVVEHPYENGLGYNKVIAQAEEQKILGWKGQIDLLEGGKLSFRLKNSAGAPLSGATVKAHITRATQQGYDFDVDLLPADAGSYEAKTAFPLPGLWNVNIEALWQKQHYYMSQDVVTRR